MTMTRGILDELMRLMGRKRRPKMALPGWTAKR
jgi:hypothetical protein